MDASAFLVKADGGEEFAISYTTTKYGWFLWHHGDNLTEYVIRSKSKGGFNAFQSWELVTTRLFL